MGIVDIIVRKDLGRAQNPLNNLSVVGAAVRIRTAMRLSIRTQSLVRNIVVLCFHA